MDIRLVWTFLSWRKRPFEQFLHGFIPIHSTQQTKPIQKKTFNISVHLRKWPSAIAELQEDALVLPAVLGRGLLDDWGWSSVSRQGRWPARLQEQDGGSHQGGRGRLGPGRQEQQGEQVLEQGHPRLLGQLQEQEQGQPRVPGLWQGGQEGQASPPAGPATA